MSSVSRPTTPIQTAPMKSECPGAPTRVLKIKIPSSPVDGKVLNFDLLTPENGAPGAPRARDAPGAPNAPRKKARFNGEFSEETVKNLFNA